MGVLLTSRAVSKVLGAKDDDMFFNNFVQLLRAPTSISSGGLKGGLTGLQPGAPNP